MLTSLTFTEMGGPCAAGGACALCAGLRGLAAPVGFVALLRLLRLPRGAAWLLLRLLTLQRRVGQRQEPETQTDSVIQPLRTRFVFSMFAILDMKVPSIGCFARIGH